MSTDIELSFVIVGIDFTFYMIGKIWMYEYLSNNIDHSKPFEIGIGLMTSIARFPDKTNSIHGDYIWGDFNRVV